jgi:hypothetical protein
MGDEKANLVHVGGDHDPGTVATFGSDNVPEDVDAQVIDEWSQLVGNNRPHPVLTTGNARCLAEPFQQIEVEGFRHVSSILRVTLANRYRLDDEIEDAL